MQTLIIRTLESKNLRIRFTGVYAFTRRFQILIVNSYLDDFTVEANDGLKFLAVMLEVDLVNFLALVFLFFDFGNLRARICLFDNRPDFLFTNRGC